MGISYGLHTYMLFLFCRDGGHAIPAQGLSAPHIHTHTAVSPGAIVRPLAVLSYNYFGLISELISTAISIER